MRVYLELGTIYSVLMVLGSLCEDILLLRPFRLLVENESGVRFRINKVWRCTECMTPYDRPPPPPLPLYTDIRKTLINGLPAMTAEKEETDYCEIHGVLQ